MVVWGRSKQVGWTHLTGTGHTSQYNDAAILDARKRCDCHIDATKAHRGGSLMQFDRTLLMEDPWLLGNAQFNNLGRARVVSFGGNPRSQVIGTLGDMTCRHEKRLTIMSNREGRAVRLERSFGCGLSRSRDNLLMLKSKYGATGLNMQGFSGGFSKDERESCQQPG